MNFNYIVCSTQMGECGYKPEEVVAKAAGCMDIEVGSEEDLQAAVAMEGPVSIAVEASLFQFYK